jgi:hypothetical protein
VALARHVLGQSDGADLGGGEHAGRDQLVIDGGRLAAVQRVGEGMAFANGDGGEVDAVGDVANGVDVVDRGA